LDDMYPFLSDAEHDEEMCKWKKVSMILIF
jgi:hypothetical protein